MTGPIGTSPGITPPTTPQPRWLMELGFRFNPFAYREASTDPRLSEYLVNHDAFATAWLEEASLVFAAAGGGKTAMRLYTTRLCWKNLGNPHPFPIPYDLSKQHRIQPIHSARGETYHLATLAQATSEALVISMAYRPQQFVSLDLESQRLLVAILTGTLQTPLWRVNDILRETGNAQEVCMLIDRTYVIPDPPTGEELEQLCNRIDALVSVPLPSFTPAEQVEHLFQLILGPLGFRSIFVLLDGVDASAETISNPSAALNWIDWLLDQTPRWAKRKIFLKGFLPLELKEPLPQLFPQLGEHCRLASLVWTRDRIAEVLRRRVYGATDGNFGSLDAFSSPQLRDIETVIAKIVKPLPREALVLADRMLYEFEQRSKGRAAQLEPEDLDAAQTWYHQNQPTFDRESRSIR